MTLVRTDVSEELSASKIRVTRIGELLCDFTRHELFSASNIPIIDEQIIGKYLEGSVSEALEALGLNVRMGYLLNETSLVSGFSTNNTARNGTRLL
jgi:hypothetical protein